MAVGPPPRRGLQAPADEDTDPHALRARARDILDRVVRLEREQVGRRAPRLERVEAVAAALDALHGAITRAAPAQFRPGDVVVLRGARRSLAEALVVTHDLLDRLRRGPDGR